MFDVSPTTEIIARALDLCSVRQAVYSANIANANVEGYRRLEVLFDQDAARSQLLLHSGMQGQQKMSALENTEPAAIVSTNSVVKLDEEMALMARNALRYETLLSAYERSTGLVKMAVREGREG